MTRPTGPGSDHPHGVPAPPDARPAAAGHAASASASPSALAPSPEAAAAAAAAAPAVDTSRRSFFKLAGAAVAGTTMAGVAGPAAAAAAKTAGAATTAGSERHAGHYTFFTAEEARFVEAAVERLIPADEIGPGALQAGVPSYIDKQLGGAWGAGERLFRAGPWQAGAPTQGYQLPFTPAELFRHAVRGVAQDVKKNGGKPFDQLGPQQQDAYLTALQEGHADLNGVPSNVFFESLLSLTIEGYFSDPVYGGNKDMAAWKMIGFPGAYAAFYTMVDQHNMLYTRSPMSLAEDASRVIHIHPQIPAYDGHQGEQHGDKAG